MIEYFKSHVYYPLNRSSEEIIKYINIPNIYTTPESIIVYCPDSKWNYYKKQLKMLDSKAENLTISYIVYYLTNEEIEKFNLNDNIYSIVNSKALFITNSSGFFTGNNINFESTGHINIKATTNEKEINFSITKDKDGVNFQIPFKEGEYKNILNGKFGKFIVLITTKKLKPIENYILTKNTSNKISITYQSSQTFSLSISFNELETFLIYKNDEYYLGTNFNLNKNFTIGAYTNISTVDKLYFLLQDTLNLNPFYLKLIANSNFEFSNINFDSILNNLLLKAGLGIEFNFENLKTNFSTYIDSNKLLSFEILLKFLNFESKFSIDSKSNFGTGIGISW